MKRGIVIVVLVLLVSVLLNRTRTVESNDLSGRAMGTDWNLKWRGDKVDREAVFAEVVTCLEKWEQVLSQWRKDSDLSRFNRGEKATEDLDRIMKLARDMKDKSGGAFDMNVLRQVGESGYGPGGDGIDLSGIGKGFAVDRVVELLKGKGMNDFVFELGGEVFAVGGVWEVAIEKPDVSGRYVGKLVRLKDSALATSGNYRLYEEVDGGLKTHIVDPRTGKAVVRKPCSVSVIGNDCATADGWATSLFVLGREYAEPEGVSVIWLDGE